MVFLESHKKNKMVSRSKTQAQGPRTKDSSMVLDVTQIDCYMPPVDY